MSGRVDFSATWAPEFWRRVARGNPSECWLWLGTLNTQGRASWFVGGRKTGRRVNAARFSYWLNNGELAAGNVVCHSCDTPACVNPSHLFAGSQAENLADMTEKGRRARFGLKGEAHHNAKLTNAQARTIATRLDGGAPAAVLATEFGVSRSAIFRAAHRGRA